MAIPAARRVEYDAITVGPVIDNIWAMTFVWR